MNKIFFAVVLYNKNFYDSDTCKQLESIVKNDKVIIADNSTKKNDVEKIAIEKKWKYILMNGNEGISNAYNAIIKYIKSEEEHDDNDVIVFVDDDTKITQEYITKLRIELEQKKHINIFMPIIKEKKNVIISPSKYTKLKIIKVKNKEQIKKIKQKNFLAINTCLAVRMKIFKEYRYTNKLFLDYVDNQFFYDMRKKGEKFVCIDTEIMQKFFSTDNNDYNKDIIRRKIQIRDYKNFIKDKTIMEKVVFYIRILYWKIKGCIKYRKITYFIDLK